MYSISYVCVSHTGHVRRINQDNFICIRQYMSSRNSGTELPLRGSVSAGKAPLFGVFDGMGGAEQGEMASFLAAETAVKFKPGRQPLRALETYCRQANENICRYAEEHGIQAMGTTAAMLAFDKTGVCLCNIGDSKVFRYAEGKLAQLSQDHLLPAAYGAKPPLSQSLGIPASELVIEPYFFKEACRDGAVYLICSDGLTDMLPEGEIEKILGTPELENAARVLLERALARGGRDNITLILCKILKKPGFFQKNKRQIMGGIV